MTLKKLYPLKFKPILRPTIWAGREFIDKHNKSLLAELEADSQEDQLPAGEILGLYDLYDTTSEVANGFLAENDLADLLETYLGDLVGDNIFEFFQLQFPLIFKLLDIKGNTSFHVHPNDEIAFERYDSYGKQEFLYVVDAEPNAKLYIGFKRDVSVAEFYEACQQGTISELMNVYTPKRGSSFIIPQGEVHSIEGGVLLAEISQPSELSMRLYDWGREDSSDPREMALEEALDCINYNKSDSHDISANKGLLIDTDKFSVNKIEITAPYSVDMDKYNGFALYIAVEGDVTLTSDNAEYQLNILESILLPSKLDEVTIIPKDGKVTLLEISIKEQKEPEDDYIK